MSEAYDQCIRNTQIGCRSSTLNGQDEILLVLQNRSPEKDTWSFPGGKIDSYEQLETCVIREVKEEVNLDVKIKQLDN
jgi:ADP-ribose pyrophosphatase YjhB (NUDIX family)